MKIKPAQRNSGGFTLIELLVVIGILSILLGITLIAINPSRQFSQANDVKRRSDVLAILNAVHQYAADNKGVLPTGIATTTTAISSTGVGATFCTSLISEYLSALPSDPLTNSGVDIEESSCAGTWDTGYEIIKSASNSRVTVSAPDTEIGTDVSIRR